MRRLATAALASELMGVVGQASAAFRSRWRLSTLHRVDEELHQRLLEQVALYEKELIAGYEDELRLQSAAMIRGWSASCACMEGHADDAYLVGVDHATRTRIVVSDHRESIEHARAITPLSQVEFRLVALSPDEVAKLVGASGLITATKHHFADAEIQSVSVSANAA